MFRSLSFSIPSHSLSCSFSQTVCLPTSLSLPLSLLLFLCLSCSLYFFLSFSLSYLPPSLSRSLSLSSLPLSLALYLSPLSLPLSLSFSLSPYPVCVFRLNSSQAFVPFNGSVISYFSTNITLSIKLRNYDIIFFSVE